MKIKRKIIGVAVAAVIAIVAALPASAATVTYTFENSGNNYGISTKCSDFSSYVTAYAKVENNGLYTQRSSRGYKSAYVTASRPWYKRNSDKKRLVYYLRINKLSL